jgi:hypothetical protein
MASIAKKVPMSASPVTSTTPFLRPNVPPPGPARELSLPDDGAWVRIISTDGSFLGRVMFSEPGRIRIKEGAGFWDIATQGILSISDAPEPARRLDEASQQARRRRNEERTLARVLDRWP